MAKTRRLSDLYAVGKEVTINDDSGAEGVTVYLRKISPLDHSTCIRKANAARALLNAGKGERAEDERAVIRSELELMDPDDVLQLIIDEEVERKRPAREAEVAARDHWSEEGKLQGLRDAWEDGLKMRWAKGEKDDPEVAGVFEELQKFDAEVDSALDSERRYLRRELEGLDTEALIERAFKQRLKLLADLLWITEFRKYEIYFATRDNVKRNERYFKEFSEVEELDPQVLLQLFAAYQELAVPVMEGKDLPETPAS